MMTPIAFRVARRNLRRPLRRFSETLSIPATSLDHLNAPLAAKAGEGSRTP